MFMKTVYDYIKMPTENRYDAYAVWYPGHKERVICGTPQHLLSRGFVIFGTCRERMQQYATAPNEVRKEYALKARGALNAVC